MTLSDLALLAAMPNSLAHLARDAGLAVEDAELLLRSLERRGLCTITGARPNRRARDARIIDRTRAGDDAVRAAARVAAMVAQTAHAIMAAPPRRAS